MLAGSTYVAAGDAGHAGRSMWALVVYETANDRATSRAADVDRESGEYQRSGPPSRSRSRNRCRQSGSVCRATLMERKVPDYKSDLDRFLADLDLQARDAEIANEKRKLDDGREVEKAINILVERLGYSREVAVEGLKRTRRFAAYFGE
jgi:hypothetical protein